MSKNVVAFVVAILIALTGAPFSSAEADTDTIAVGVTSLEFRPGTGQVSTVDGKPALVFRNLQGSGTIECRGVVACEDAGFDGAGLKVQQDLGIVVVGDIIVPLRGQVRGMIVIDRGPGYSLIRVGFAGDVTGDSAGGGGAWPEEISLNLSGLVTRWTDATGHMDLSSSEPDVLGDFDFDLSGVVRVSMGAGGRTVTLADLAGGGITNLIAVFPSA